MKLVERTNPAAEDRAPILRSLRANNVARMPHLPDVVGTYAVFIQDEAGETTGGLWADWMLDWIFVELVVVPENLRGKGVGAKLMSRVEAHARERGCIGVWLDTFGFQARGFYEKLGYTCFATLEGRERKADRYLLRKYLG